MKTEGTSKKGESCTEEESKMVGSHLCPDCGGPLYDGPCGGLSINMYCGNQKCGSRFNEMGPFGSDRISDASPNRPQEPLASTGPYR
jgi:hypothetical protein